MAPTPDPDASPSTLITGAASGIGRHLTGRLAALGHRVLATDLSQQALEATAEADGWADVRCCTLDVTDAGSWDSVMAEALESLGGLDVLINNAGVLKPGRVYDISPADIDFHLSVNVRGVMLGTAAAAAHMKARGSGHIVNIGSLASVAPVPGLALYAASKFAVRGFSLSAALDLRPHGVAVTVVMPDAVQTPMLDDQVDYEEAALTFSGRRQLTVEDVGRAIVERVLRKRPLECGLPTSRAVMARAGGMAPGLAAMIEGPMRRKGMALQARMRGARDDALSGPGTDADG